MPAMHSVQRTSLELDECRCRRFEQARGGGDRGIRGMSVRAGRGGDQRRRRCRQCKLSDCDAERGDRSGSLHAR